MKRKIARVFLELMRHHITAMAIISVVNMILIISGSKYIIYFSTLLPQFLTARGFSMAISSGYAPLEIISVVLGGIFILLLLLTAIFSYKRRAWHLVAAGLVLADLSIALIMLIGEGNMSFLPDAIINGYVVLVSIGAFFVSGALASVAAEDDWYDELDGISDFKSITEEQDSELVGYGDYTVPVTAPAEIVETETALSDSAEENTEVSETLPETEPSDKTVLEKGVLFKVTFRVPTFKSLRDALGLEENDNEEE